MDKTISQTWTHLENDTLANEVLTVHREQNLPGLVAECEEWMETYNLSNLFEVKIIQPCHWKLKKCSSMSLTVVMLGCLI